MRAIFAIVVAGLALLAAACGGSTSNDVAALGSTQSTAPAAAAAATEAVAFARCMRAHGIPNFPDPTGSGVFDKNTLRALGISVSRLRAVQDGPCKNLRPNRPAGSQQSRTQIADELSFARCMRSHGVRAFPDPTTQSGLSVSAVEAAGIDVHSPAVLRAAYACVPASHGGLTAAKIRKALHDARP